LRANNTRTIPNRAKEKVSRLDSPQRTYSQIAYRVRTSRLLIHSPPPILAHMQALDHTHAPPDAGHALAHPPLVGGARGALRLVLVRRRIDQRAEPSLVADHDDRLPHPAAQLADQRAVAPAQARVDVRRFGLDAAQQVLVAVARGEGQDRAVAVDKRGGLVVERFEERVGFSVERVGVWGG